MPEKLDDANPQPDTEMHSTGSPGVLHTLTNLEGLRTPSFCVSMETVSCRCDWLIGVVGPWQLIEPPAPVSLPEAMGGRGTGSSSLLITRWFPLATAPILKCFPKILSLTWHKTYIYIFFFHPIGHSKVCRSSVPKGLRPTIYLFLTLCLIINYNITNVKLEYWEQS